MRITTNMLTWDMLSNLNRNLNSMSKYQEHISTGKKINKASDDPLGTTKILKYKTDISENQLFSDNVRDSKGYLEVTENAMTDVKEILQRVRELCVQGSNGTYDEKDTQKISLEIKELTEEVLVLGNSTVAGRYIFSGYETDEKLFNEDGTYNIDFTNEKLTEKNSLSFQVAVGEEIKAGTWPTDIFGLVNVNNYTTDNIPSGTVKSKASTYSRLKGTFDPAYDYSGKALTVTVGGTTYTALDATNKAGKLDKEQIIKTLKGAKAGTKLLQETADIYFDNDDKLIIKSKKSGNVAINAVGIAGAATTPGTVSADGSIKHAVGATVYTMTDTQSFYVNYNGEKTKISVDMTPIKNGGDYATEVQNQIDTKFGAGKINVNFSTGPDEMTFTVKGSADGKENTMKIEHIQGRESQMIHDLKAITDALDRGDHAFIASQTSVIDEHLNKAIKEMGTIGGKVNRVDYINNRIDNDKMAYTSMLSEVQDTDMAEAIIQLQTTENIYKAALSVGSKVIQPSLLDFIK